MGGVFQETQASATCHGFWGTRNEVRSSSCGTSEAHRLGPSGPWRGRGEPGDPPRVDPPRQSWRATPASRLKLCPLHPTPLPALSTWSVNVPANTRDVPFSVTGGSGPHGQRALSCLPAGRAPRHTLPEAQLTLGGWRCPAHPHLVSLHLYMGNSWLWQAGGHCGSLLTLAAGVFPLVPNHQSQGWQGHGVRSWSELSLWPNGGDGAQA